MPKRIELPAQIGGEPEAQLKQLYSYLYQMAEALNSNLAEIGGNALTDDEMVIMRDVIGDGNPDGPGMSEGETLKSMIIKTAQFVRSQIDEYNLTLTGTYEAEGKLGKYVRKTRLDVDVTPSGIQQNYTFQDIIQGLKTYEVNAKNYIKTGLLRTVSSVPVYGVAIGKDVVTFSEDGTETYNDGNKVAELTADELSFWQNSSKVASYTGSKISFYNGGSEVMYIQNGKIYCTNDLELASGKKLIITTDNLSIDANGNVVLKGDVEILSGKSLAVKTGGAFTVDSGNFSIDSSGNVVLKGAAEILSGKALAIKSGGDLNVESGGDLNIKSGGAFTIDSGNFSIDSSGNVMLKGAAEILSGKSLDIKSGGDLNIESGGGIDIHATGELELTGSTVSIKSGSTFDVEATNFQISSQDKKMVSGNWTFDDNGMLHDAGNNKNKFAIVKTESALPNNTSGIVFNQTSQSSYTYDGIKFVINAKYGGSHYSENELHYGCEYGGTGAALYPNTNAVNLGKAGKPFGTVFCGNQHMGSYGTISTETDTLTIRVNETLSGGYYTGPELYITMAGSDMIVSGSGSVIFKGNQWGGLYLEEPSSTKNLNNMTTPGTYFLDQYTTNQPTGLTGDFMLEVMTGMDTDPPVVQRITSASLIYIRQRPAGANASWGSWYKFTGTAV